MSKPIYLRQSLSQESTLKGEISGVAYTGAVIPNYSFYKNFIVDLATLTIDREKIPFLKDHDLGKVAGHGTATLEDGKILINGKISQKSSHGQEIIGLAEEGFEWQLSIGVFDGTVEEIENVEVNGFMVTHGFVLRNGTLREVSFVSLGADKDTEATIFSDKKGETVMINMTPEAYAKLACACGGDKDTKPEELAAKLEETQEAQEEKVKELESEIEAKKAEVEKLQSELDAIKEGEAVEQRAEEIEMAAKAKSIKFSADKVKEAAKSEETTKTLLSLISDMKPQGKIDSKLAGKDDLGGGKVTKKTSDEIRLEARKLIKDGLAKDMFEAMTLVEAK